MVSLRRRGAGYAPYLIRPVAPDIVTRTHCFWPGQRVCGYYCAEGEALVTSQSGHVWAVVSEGVFHAVRGAMGLRRFDFPIQSHGFLQVDK